MNLNSIHLIGRVTKDPELRQTKGGTGVTTFGVATNHVYKDKSGAKQETAQFHNCVAFGRTAEIVGQFVRKGQEVFVAGRVEYRSWEDKNGQKRYTTEVIVENLQMGQRAKGDQGRQSARPDLSIDEVPGLSMDAGQELPTVQDGEIDIESIPF